MICNFLLISALSIVISIVFGYYFSLRLPVLHRFFDRKPFNCRPCFTFHLCWAMQAIYGVMMGRLVYVLVGILIALILFFIVKYIDNQKIEE